MQNQRNRKRLATAAMLLTLALVLVAYAFLPQPMNCLLQVIPLLAALRSYNACIPYPLFLALKHVQDSSQSRTLKG